MLTTNERTMKGWLRVFTVAFLIAAFVYGLGPFVGPLSGLFGEIPFVANSVVKVLLLMLLCMYGAGDFRQRHGLVAILIVAHAVSIVIMLVFQVYADPTVVQVGGSLRSMSTVLWGAIALDGVIVVLLLWFFLRARSARRRADVVRDEGRVPTVKRSLEGRGNVISGSDVALRAVLVSLGVVLAGATVAFGLGPIWGTTQDFFVQLPFVSNSAVRTATAALICFYIVADMRTRLPLVSILITASLVSAAVSLLFLGFGPSSGTAVFGTRQISVATILTAGIAVDIAVVMLLWWLKRAAWRSRLSPRYLGATGYRALIALADVLVAGPKEAVPPLRIARTADRTLESIRAKRKWLQRAIVTLLQLHPVLYLKAPFSELDEEERLRHLKIHFQRDVTLRLIPNWWRNVVQVMIRVAKQLTYLGYYNDRDADASIGYARFEERERFKRLEQQGPDVVPPRDREFPLDVLTPERHDHTTAEADVCIIGSGAAGGVLAYHLAKEGLNVIVLERGQYVKPPDFTSDEVEMMGKLYADGLFQQTRDFQFTVLQGSCVGGSTVVNNAVSFAPPDHVLDRWNDPDGYDAGLNRNDLQKSIQYIEQWLRITPQDPSAPQHRNLRLNPSYPEYLDGVQKLGLNDLSVAPVAANIEGCLGCGYCNIGCAYGKKLSMLDTALPWAQRDFPEKLQIYSECQVLKIRHTGNGQHRQATAVEAQLPGGRRITVRARKIVVAAGTVASSYLLMKSGIGIGLPVGEHVSFNMGAPLTADFDREMNAYDGLQISHFGVPPAERGWVFETWWNPPVAQAINMPGWFEQHYDNMKRYPHMMAVGALVGTQRNAKIRPALTGGPDVVYTPTPGDLRKLGDALVELGQILFAAGAKRVLLNAWNYYEFRSPHGLSEIPRIVLDPTDLTLGTGHPQGGNAISQNPDLGVVGPDFRVHGFRNLYVCDASVFPSSLTVNPQETVMTLAHYAVPRIAS